MTNMLQKISEYQRVEKDFLHNSNLIDIFARVYEARLLEDFEPQSWHQFDLFWDHKDYEFFPKEKRYTIGLLTQAAAAAFVFKTDSIQVFELVNTDLFNKINELSRNKKMLSVRVFSDIMKAANTDTVERLVSQMVDIGYKNENDSRRKP